MGLFGDFKLPWENDKMKTVIASSDAYLNYKHSRNEFGDGDFANVSTIYTCIRILAGVISRLPINILNTKDDGSQFIDKSDPLYAKLHYHPNDYTSSQKFIATLEYFRNLNGNAFAWIHRNAKGKAESFEILPPSQVSDGGIINNQAYYHYNKQTRDAQGNVTSTEKIVINGMDMLHFTTNSIGLWGISPIDKLLYPLKINLKAQKTIDTFLTNNLNVPKALVPVEVTGQMNQFNITSMEETMKKFKENYTDGTWITMPIGWDVKELSMSFVDAELVQQLKLTKGEIASYFGVPGSLVGLYESSKFSSVEQMLLEFKSNTISDILRMYRQELEFKLLTDEERLKGKSIEFNVQAMIESDLNSKINLIKTELGLGMSTPNELCTYLGIPTHDTELYPGADSLFIANGYSRIDNRNPNNIFIDGSLGI